MCGTLTQLLAFLLLVTTSETQTEQQQLEEQTHLPSQEPKAEQEQTILIQQPEKSSESLSVSKAKLIAQLLKGYEKDEPPFLDKATEVEVGFYINSFPAFNEQAMTYRVK